MALKIVIKEYALSNTTSKTGRTFEPTGDDIRKDEGTFGENVKKLLMGMLVGKSLPTSIKGTPEQVEALKATLNAEADYINSYISAGSEAADTMRKKINLNVQIKEFERINLMKWPLK